MNVRTLCLGILAHGEASGYEIKKAVEEGMFSHFIEASYGSIYPALTQMLGEGLVSVCDVIQDGKPQKKVYSITEAGHAVLRKSLHELPKKDKFKSEFLFQTLFLEKIGQDHLEQIFEAHMEYLRHELACVEECREKAAPDSGHAFVNGYGRAVLTAAINYMEAARPSLGVDADAAPRSAAE